MALSKTQTKRLGSLLSIMFEDGKLPEPILKELLDKDFAKLKGTKYILTERGLSEKNRLCTLAGLNIMYQSEKDSNRSSKSFLTRRNDIKGVLLWVISYDRIGHQILALLF